MDIVDFADETPPLEIGSESKDSLSRRTDKTLAVFLRWFLEMAESRPQATEIIHTVEYFERKNILEISESNISVDQNILYHVSIFLQYLSISVNFVELWHLKNTTMR